MQRVDILHLRQGNFAKPYYTNDSDPNERGLLLRWLLGQADAFGPGDRLELAAGEFACGGQGLKNGYVQLPGNVELRGAGRDQTTLSSTFNIGAEPGTACSFEVSAGTTLCDLRLEDKVPLERQSMLIGCTPGSGPRGIARTFTLRRVDVFARAWGVYLWASPVSGNKVFLDEVYVLSGKQCLSLCDSGNGNHADVQNTRLVIDSSRSTYGNAVSELLSCVVVRGGTTRLRNTLLVVPNSDNLPDYKEGQPVRVAAITTKYGPSNSAGNATVLCESGVRFQVQASAKKDRTSYAIDHYFGRVWLGRDVAERSLTIGGTKAVEIEANILPPDVPALEAIIGGASAAKN
jgi:hypothetical protein